MQVVGSSFEPKTVELFRNLTSSKIFGAIPLILSRLNLGLLVEHISVQNRRYMQPFPQFVLQIQDIWSISTTVPDGKLPGSAKDWLEQLESGSQTAYLKLLLNLTPNLKSLILCFTDPGYMQGLHEIAESGAHLQRPESLMPMRDRRVTDEGQQLDIIHIHQFPSILQLPSLRRLMVRMAHVGDKYMEEARYSKHLKRWFEKPPPRIKELCLESSTIGPIYLAELLAATQCLQVFEYDTMDLYGLAIGEMEPDVASMNGTFEPPELTQSLMRHRLSRLSNSTTFAQKSPQDSNSGAATTTPSASSPSSAL